MNILLVYPEMPDTFWVMKHTLKITGKKAWYPPLGLLTVAAMLPEDWNKRLVDLNVKPLTDEDFRLADYIFLGAMNVQEVSVRHIISRCGEAGVKVVAGGPLFTHEHERFSGVEHFVLNEAEITLPRFLLDLADGSPRHLYKSTEYANVHSTPLPQWELAQLDSYQYAIVQYSRGCPYMCDFCDVTSLFGRRPRTKTCEQIIVELDVLVDSGKFPAVLFADDNLIGNKKLLKEELLPALIDWRRKKNPPMTFSTQVTINLADDPELMQMMLDAGFRHLFIGIETPDEQSLVECKKQQNTKRDLRADVRRLHKAGFVVVAGFIVGFDTDTPAIFQRQIDFIQDSGIVLATVNLLKAPPGTELYERMKREGRLVDEFSFEEVRTNFLPKMGAEALYKGFDKVVRHVYSPEYAHLRACKFLQEYEKNPKVDREVPVTKHLERIGVLLRSFYYIGIVDKMRYFYWKLIFRTVLKRPKLVDWAILQAIMIYQLRKLFESYSMNGEYDVDQARPRLYEASATKVWFDKYNMWMNLSDGRQLSVPLEYFPRLRNAKPSQREKYVLSGNGTGIHWEEIDEDISVPGLLMGKKDLTNHK